MAAPAKNPWDDLPVVADKAPWDALPPAPPVPNKLATVDTKPTLAEMFAQEAMSGPVMKRAARVIVGAADPNIAATQIVANAVGTGDKVNRRVTDMNADIAATRGEDGDSIDLLRMGGNLLNPAVIKAFQAIPQGLSVLQKVITGMVAGGGGAALSPVDLKSSPGEEKTFAGEKVKKIAEGVAIGGAVPLISAAVTPIAKTAYRATLEPIIDKAAVKGRAYVQSAGDKVDEVVAALKQNEQIVSGSMPTAGEAATKAGSTEFSALQAAASKFRPTEYQARIDEQNAARLAQVRTVAQDEASLKAAETARDLAAKGNYAGAFRTVIKADPELARLASNPYFKDAAVAANKMAAADKIDPKTQLTQYLDLVVKGMQDKISKSGDGSLGPNEKRLVTNAKEKLVDWISAKNPAYAQARDEFAAASRPINQMQIGQELEKKLVPALSEEAKQRAGVFANAVQDSTSLIKKATGQPRFQSLTEALEPTQMAAIQSVQDDLARGARFDVLSKKGAGSVSLADIPEKVSAPALLNRVATIANAIVERAQGKINKQIASEIAAEMLNPVTVADSMQKSLLKTTRNKLLAEKAAKLTNAAVFAAQE